MILTAGTQSMNVLIHCEQLEFYKLNEFGEQHDQMQVFDFQN